MGCFFLWLSFVLFSKSKWCASLESILPVTGILPVVNVVASGFWR